MITCNQGNTPFLRPSCLKRRLQGPTDTMQTLTNAIEKLCVPFATTDPPNLNAQGYFPVDSDGLRHNPPKSRPSFVAPEPPLPSSFQLQHCHTLPRPAQPKAQPSLQPWRRTTPTCSHAALLSRLPSPMGSSCRRRLMRWAEGVAAGGSGRGLGAVQTLGRAPRGRRRRAPSQAALLTYQPFDPPTLTWCLVPARPPACTARTDRPPRPRRSGRNRGCCGAAGARDATGRRRQRPRRSWTTR